MRILRRYIWKEFLQSFIVSGLVLTVLGIGKIVFDYNDFFIGFRVTAGLLVSLILNQIPSLFMDVIPAATMCGVILALGRLLREREMDVIRVSGVSFIKIMLPIFSGILLICVAAYWWNDLVVPAANHHFQNEVRRLSNQQSMPLLKENVVIKGPYNRFIYLNRVERRTGKISGVLIMEVGSTPGRWPRIITADYGALHHGVWKLHNGFIHQLDNTGAVTAEMRYQTMDIKMGDDFSAAMGDEKAPGEMRASELYEIIARYKKSGLNIPVYTVYYHSKFADPLISLVLAFLAAPLAFTTGRNSRWLGLGFGLVIVLGYYALQVIGRTMGANGVISPWLAAWAPHLVFMMIGIALLYRVERRR